LTPLYADDGRGVNSIFNLKRQGQNHKMQKPGVKSPLTFKVGVQTQMPLKGFLLLFSVEFRDDFDF
jgi:hypothetical protein